MAILWAESFDLYGVVIAQMQLRGYVTASGALATGARTGGVCYYLQANGVAQALTRILDTPVNVIGMGCALMVTTNAITNVGSKGIQFGFAAADTYKVLVNGDLGYSIYNGVTLIGSTRPNCWVLNIYNYLEVKARNNAATGTTGDIELKVNGITELLVTGVSIATQFQRVGFGSTGGSTGNGWCKIDDWVVWDDSGTYNNNFLGDRRCETVFPNGNGPTQDWVASTGTAWSCIDESTPSDVDYIQASAAGNVSNFTKTAIGVATNDIAGVLVVARALKTDAGASDLRVGIQSGAFVDNGPSTPLTTSAAYYSRIFERDPNGTVAWTKAAADAALISLTRSV